MNPVRSVLCVLCGSSVSLRFLRLELRAEIRRGQRVNENPWDATTLEWSAPSPPGHGNFLTEPIAYRGPYEYSVPGAARDFTPQFEPERS